jgi:hypothetical protein
MSIVATQARLAAWLLRTSASVAISSFSPQVAAVCIFSFFLRQLAWISMAPAYARGQTKLTRCDLQTKLASQPALPVLPNILKGVVSLLPPCLFSGCAKLARRHFA